jgi:DNA invertase Pin-like site-specific DNA recombinase
MADGRFIAYYRVSTDRQGRSGLGLEAQRQAVLDYLNGGGWKMVGEFTDVETGRSPARLTLAKRPQLQAALSEAKRRKATLIFAKLDRLARNVAFISALMETGVDFVAADMPSANRFMLHVYAALGEEEGRRIADRTRAALQAAKARGVKLGKTGRERAAENRAQANTFARKLRPALRELRAAGVTTVRGVAEELNRRGIATPRGGQWHPTSAARLLARMPSGTR